MFYFTCQVRKIIIILHTTIKEAYLRTLTTPISRKFQRATTEKLQKHTDLKEELLRLWQLKTTYAFHNALRNYKNL
jgi:hypothetical protein